jgi:Zn-dependent alcohol dehydrogenase
VQRTGRLAPDQVNDHFDLMHDGKAIGQVAVSDIGSIDG